MTPQFPIERRVKIYIALLTQTGTDAPVAIELQNTYDTDFQWFYTSPGMYLVLTGNNAFPTDRTTVLLSNGYVTESSWVQGQKGGDNNVVIRTYNRDSGYTNGLLTNTLIEIRQYPDETITY